MHYQRKYLNAIKNRINLIGDKILREVLIEQFNIFNYLEEVRFQGFTADVLFIDTKDTLLWGIEVKSDRDNLDRLESQLYGYLANCNIVFIATTLSQRKNVLRILDKPEFKDVGLLTYYMNNGQRFFRTEKEAVNAKIKGNGINWITKKHQLYQWIYLLEEIWGE